MQPLAPPVGPHNPRGATREEVLRALRAVDGANRMSFRYELLDRNDVKIRDLEEIVDGTVSLNNLAVIKRTATFTLRSGGGLIDWLSDRIQPWARLHLPPYGPEDFVEWPLGVFNLVTPTREVDGTGTVWRRVEGYDKLQILEEDLIASRLSTDSPEMLLVRDPFLRNVTGGWGLTPAGIGWSLIVTGPPTTWGVTTAGAGYAFVTLTEQPATLRIQLPHRRSADADVRTTMAVSVTATGAAFLPSIVLRYRSTADFYRLRVHFNTNGTLSLSVADRTTQVGATETTGLSYTPGTMVNVRARIIGQTITGKVWPAGAPEPEAWGIERTIESADPLTQGWMGLSASSFGGNTNTSPQLRYGSFAWDGNPLRLVTLAVRRVLQLGGVNSHRITPSEERLTTVREWEPGTSHLAIVNELLDAIAYRSLSIDERGVAVATPYVPPAERPAEYEYLDDEVSVMDPEAVQERDLHSIPNRWVLTRSEPDEPAITVTYTNSDPASPTSTVRRGRVITDFRDQEDATSESALIERAANLAQEATQVYEAIEYSTAPMPVHSNDDVVRIRRDDLALDGKFSSHTWDLELKAGGQMRHRARRVVSLTAASDPSIVVGDVTVTGAVEAGNWRTGTVIVTPVPNTPTPVVITGLNLTGTGPVRVQVTPDTSVPGSTFREAAVRNPSPNGFTLWVFRTNATNTGIFWLAMRGA
ncbi:hypothetical protein GCM10027160_23510 [Streptomyces calidiresistens]|uniref:Minor tail protein n=1 Tax=Streptomyces calidiresistens TaxID=1485586 RepID=A0A7W3T2W3_9ACTN|nr:hypothetical protein [Streptomyces calidiresistens]MBB0229893.1 hypothetical protein [Streptomyces calidiresistens]